MAMADMRTTRASHDNHAQMLTALQTLQAISLHHQSAMGQSGLL